MRRGRRAVVAGLAVMAGSLGACGGDGGPLEDADAAMADLDAGRLRLQLSATAGADERTGPVGFRMEGPFSTADGALPVLDLTYTRLLGSSESVMRVVSTGEAVFVVTDGKVTPVPPQQSAALRLGDGDGGVADLGIAGWVDDPKVRDGADGARTVTGKLDVADLMSDLARIGEQVGGGTGGQRLDAAAAERLSALARASQVVVELGADDLPRSLRAVVDFGGRVPDELREALGPYASPRMELTLALERLTEPLVVDAPTG